MSFEHKTTRRDGICLICGDGGIKGGFIAGAVSALIEEFPDLLEKIDTISATSASVGSMCYLISHGKDHPGRKIWTEELSSDKFLNINNPSDLFTNKKVYDLDYMVYGIFKDKYPLDINKINTGKIAFYFSVQNYSNCEVEYFSNTDENYMVRNEKKRPIHNFSELNLYELIKAAGAAPFIYDQTVTIKGTDYMDAATLEPFTADFPAMEGKRKIVVLTKFDQSFKRKMTYLFSGLLWPFLINPFRKIKFKPAIYFQYARKPKIIEQLAREMEADTKALVISPRKKIGGIFENDHETLTKNYEHGREVVRAELEKISNFIA